MYENKSTTHGDSGNCGIDGGTLTDLHFIHWLLKHGASSIGSGNDIHLDNRLWILATLVGSLHGDAILLTRIQFSYGFNNASLWIYLKFVQAVVRYVINTIRYFRVLSFVVVRCFDLRAKLKINFYKKVFKKDKYRYLIIIPKGTRASREETRKNRSIRDHLSLPNHR